MSAQLESLLKRLDEIVDGIDRDECGDGWWATEKGVELGKTTLRELRQLVTEAAQSAEARAALADGPAVPDGREPAAVAGEPSDEELKAAYWEGFQDASMCGAEASWLAGLRAVARWGRPATSPAPEPGEVGEP